MITITMPALSPTMEEGKLAKWLVKEGDTVSAGDIIAEIETDKATMEYESIDDGTVGKLLVSEGQEAIKINAPIAVLLEEGEDKAALASFKIPEAPPAPAAGGDAAKPDKPAAPETAAPAPVAAAEKPSVQGTKPGARIVASPLARRLAAQKGLDLARITGSGPHGRIIKRDLDGAQPMAAAAPATAKTVAKPAANELALFAEGSYEVVAHTPMRKTIARRLTESKSTIPHFYLTVECDLDGLLEMRQTLNARAPKDEGAYKLSVNDFIIRASALALKRVPEAHASWTDAGLLRHKHADIGVAVSIEGGLITPIIRHADAMGLAEISNAMRDLAERARVRKLKPSEYEGGTFSISNLGMFGIREFSAVINPPHSMILAVGAGEQRPVVRNGALAIATQMSCTLSCDHRVVDGVLGAQFLNVFKGFIENPLTMLL
ncbi:MAG: pyruvate dehydrogenase complex dihydrolipoamide acetyltransferase [Alphaproteobacteria bacterium]